MNMAQILAPTAIYPALDVTCEKQALLRLADYASDITGESAHTIFEALMERERLGSTAIGGGVAIPHARLPGIHAVMAIFVRLSHSVRYNPPDDSKVDLMFMILAPEGENGEHLKALARISRVLRDPDVCEEIRLAGGADEIFRLLTSHDE